MIYLDIKWYWHILSYLYVIYLIHLEGFGSKEACQGEVRLAKSRPRTRALPRMAHSGSSWPSFDFGWEINREVNGDVPQRLFTHVWGIMRCTPWDLGVSLGGILEHRHSNPGSQTPILGFWMIHQGMGQNNWPAPKNGCNVGKTMP